MGKKGLKLLCQKKNSCIQFFSHSNKKKKNERTKNNYTAFGMASTKISAKKRVDDIENYYYVQR